MLYILIITGLIIVWCILTFNKIVKSKNMISEAFSGVDVQLKRRYDLIPNLVEVVKGYSRYEKSIFDDIANIRSRSINTYNLQQRSEQENTLTNSLKGIFVIAENYPDLKANNNFLELQKTLIDIEEQLQYARRYYNGTVRDYNILIETFPSNIIASVFNYKKEEFFEIECVTQRENPDVEL